MPIEINPSNPKAISPQIGYSYHLLPCHRDMFLGVEGRRGTAKTLSILLHIIARARANPGSHWLLARSTRTLLADSVLRTLEEQVLPLLRIPRPNADRNHVTSYPVGNGSFIIPRGLDEISRNQSAEYSGGYVAEAPEMKTRVEVESLAGAMREQKVDYHQIIVDCNPADPMHWLNLAMEPVDSSIRRVATIEDYRRLLLHNREPAAPGKWKRIITHWADNPGFWCLDPFGPNAVGTAYIDRTLSNLVGFLRRNWFDGEWSAAEGAVFPAYNDSFDGHLVPDFDPPDFWPQVVALDPGWHNCGIVWMCVAPDGGIFVFDAIQVQKREFSVHCEEILRRNREGKRNILRYFADPNEAFATKSNGPAVAVQARAHDIRFIPWPADRGAAFDAGVEAIRDLLIAPEGKPFYLRVCERARGFRANMTAWSYRRNAAGILIEGAERYEAANDHCIDPVRGVIQSGFLQRMFAQMNRVA